MDGTGTTMGTVVTNDYHVIDRRPMVFRYPKKKRAMTREQALALVIALALLACVGLLLTRRGSAGAVCLTPRADSCGGSVAALYEARGANPCAIVKARIGEYCTAFCIDTGFAGPCLLSLPCLARAPPLAPVDDVVEWAERAQPVVALAAASTVEQASALHAFAVRNRCSDFTSGCTMRLASIGATKESTSEMLLSPPLELATPNVRGEAEPLSSLWTSARACSGQPVAEVLASTPMPTLHILTCDWLVQNSPALLAPHIGTLTTNLSSDAFAIERASMHTIATELSGGAFVATIKVEGVSFRVTVDSGAACYLSLGKQAASKLRTCRPTGRTMRQVGANGERICAHAVTAHIELCGSTEDVPVLINDMALDSEDGYVGWCFLRHFDLCVTPNAVYARRNAAPFDASMLDTTLSDTPCAEPCMACVPSKG
jgi:predicted aspartyl protease